VVSITRYSPMQQKAVAGTYRKGGARLLSRIMSAYTDDTILCQRHLAPGLGREELFDTPKDEVVLQHCLFRHHISLDLLAYSPSDFFVPTLDIDVA